MADRVVLHVGLPKTGTTYLQRLLWANREPLQAVGVDLVVDHMRRLFDAARDLGRGGDGDWRRLVDEVNAAPGTVVLSCEGLSAVPAHQAERAFADLGATELRIICTLRDYAQLVPSVWQQHIRTGSTVELSAFVAHVRDGMTWSWLPSATDVLDAWATNVDPHCVRLVTLPTTSADPGLLWRRFAEACDLDPQVATDLPPVANSSLGAVQSELLRRLNAALGDRVPVEEPRYRELLRPMLNPRALAKASGPHPVLQPEDRTWAIEQAHQLVSMLRGRGYPVVGDLDDLLPDVRDEAKAGAVTSPTEAEVAAAAVELSADVLLALRSARRDAPPADGPRAHRARGGGRGNRRNRPD